MAIFSFMGRAISTGNTLLSDNTKPYVYWFADQTVFDGQALEFVFCGCWRETVDRRRGAWAPHASDMRENNTVSEELALKGKVERASNLGVSIEVRITCNEACREA